jgi:hypothetical protein
MTRAILNEGVEQNGAVSDPPLSAEHRGSDSEMDASLNETPPAVPTAEEEIERLRAENAAFRESLEQLEKILEERLQNEQTWEERQKEQDALLEEKSDVIRELHLKLQECSTAPAPHESGAVPREEELLALSEELEQERRQLKEDEESLMAQMREMEIQMSRERAELARQRNELQRLHSDLHHELELAARNAALRDRLQPLQRRHQDLLHRKGGEPSREAPSRAVPNSDSPPSQDAAARDNKSLLGRLFG